MNGPSDVRRILIIDDHESIHSDFRKILCSDYEESEAWVSLERDAAALFGAAEDAPREIRYSVDSAFQGTEGLEMVRDAKKKDRPYAVAFVDVCIPPGWDGIETVKRIWKEAPDLHVVFCTAHSDYSWQRMVNKLGVTDRFLMLKKPFENIEIRQMACAMTEKYFFLKKTRAKFAQMQQMLDIRTKRLLQASEKSEELNDDLTNTNARLGREVKARKESVDELRKTRVLLKSDMPDLANMKAEDISATLMKGVGGKIEALLAQDNLTDSDRERLTRMRSIISETQEL